LFVKIFTRSTGCCGKGDQAAQGVAKTRVSFRRWEIEIGHGSGATGPELSEAEAIVFFMIRDRCYDFKNIFAKKLQKIGAFLTQNKAKLCNFLLKTLVFEKNAIFSPKIVENRRKL
jgi:hypothetical protein